MKETAVVVPDELDYEYTLPTQDEIKQLEAENQAKIEAEFANPDSGLEKIKWDQRHPTKKTKAKYLNPKTGKYVSYIRAVQLKLT